MIFANVAMLECQCRRGRIQYKMKVYIISAFNVKLFIRKKLLQRGDNSEIQINGKLLVLIEKKFRGNH